VENTIIRTFRSPWGAFIFVGALGVLAACYSLNPGHIDPDTLGPRTVLDGLEVKLLRYSTDCDPKASAPLVAEVGDGCEFPGHEVELLGSLCAEAPSPAVDVYVGERDLIFDFSNVAEPGRFPGAEFEGYIIDILRSKDGPIIFGMAVDDDMTTIDTDSVSLSHDDDHLEVNFQGVSYDQDSFVRIKLWLATMEFQRDDAE
jgi:hypothetical protein